MMMRKNKEVKKMSNNIYEDLVSRTQKVANEVYGEKGITRFDDYLETVTGIRYDSILHYHDMAPEERRGSSGLLESVKQLISDKIDIVRAREMRRVLKSRGQGAGPE